MKTTRDRTEHLLEKHAGEIDELLHEASLVMSKSQANTSSANNNAAAAASSSSNLTTAAAASSSTSATLSPQKSLTSPDFSFSTYSNIDTSPSVNNFLLPTSSLLPSSSTSASTTGGAHQQKEQHHQHIRLKPIDEGIGGSTKILKKAQKQERQWYRENILVPKKVEQEEKKKKEQLLLEQEEQQQKEALEKLPPQPLELTRFWLLRGIRGSLAPDARSLHTVAIFDDEMYVFGGVINNTNNNYPSDDFYVCRNLGSVHGVRWSSLATSQTSSSSATAAVLQHSHHHHHQEQEDVGVVSSLSLTPPARSQHTMTVLKQRPDGDAGLFLFGGVGAEGELLDDCWFFNLVQQRWNRIIQTSSSSSTSVSTSTSVSSTPIRSETTTSTVNVDPNNNNNAPTARCAHSCVMLRNYAFIFGGRSVKRSDPKSSRVCRDLYVFDCTSSHRWLKMEIPSSSSKESSNNNDAAATSSSSSSSNNKNDIVNSWPSERYFHAAASDPSGERMFIHGGIDAKGRTLSDLWLMDYSSRLWREVHGMTTVAGVPRARHGLIGLSSRQVMLIGGVSMLVEESATPAIILDQHQNNLAASLGLVVTIGEEQKEQEDINNNNKKKTSQQQNLFIVETLQSQPFIGAQPQDTCYHSFGGVAISNGCAFVFSGVTPSESINNTNNSNDTTNTNTNNNNNNNISVKGSVGRFALPPPPPPQKQQQQQKPQKQQQHIADNLYDQKSLFSLWASRRWSRIASPVTHDIELQWNNNNNSADQQHQHQHHSLFYVHSSIMKIRAPILWKSITIQCHSQKRKVGTGIFASWITRYELVAAAASQHHHTNTSSSSSSHATAATTTTVVTAGRRKTEVLDAPEGMLSYEILFELISFIYRGIFSESTSKRIAQSDNRLVSIFTSVARKYQMQSLSQYLNALLVGTENSSNNNNPQHQQVSLTSRRTTAERIGVASAIDDCFSAISAAYYSSSSNSNSSSAASSASSASSIGVPGDVKLIIQESPTPNSATETIRVHSAIVTCASSVLRTALKGGSIEGENCKLEIEHHHVANSNNNTDNNNDDSETTIHVLKGLCMPLGSALAAAIEHMYTGKVEGINLCNHFEIALVASKLDLPFLLAAAERALLDSLSPSLMEKPIQQIISSLRLAVSHECGRVVETLMNTAAIRIQEVDASLFREMSIDSQEELIRTSEELYPQGLEEIVMLKKQIEATTTTKRKVGNSTIAKSSDVYSSRSIAANFLQTD